MRKVLHIFIFSCLLVSCEKKRADSPPTLPPFPKTVTTRPAEKARIPVAEAAVESPVPQILKLSPTATKQKVLMGAINAWNALPSENKGAELLQKRRDLAYVTLGELQGSLELTKFLEFLKSQGAADLRQEMLDHWLEPLFKGEGAAGLRQWLLTLEDRDLKQKLMIQAGAGFVGEGFAEYFAQVGTSADGHNCQCRVLTGYCSTLAEAEPERAIELYREMATPLRIDNTGLATVMAHLPADADFSKIVNNVAPDVRGLSKGTRASLLKNWSGHQPEEAALYVMSNTSVADADQMTVVMDVWAPQDAAAAAKWLSEFPASAHKDQGSLSLSKNWLKQRNPAQAFASAASISNFELKVKTATEVFNEWAKSDRKAAEAEWVKVFPQGQNQ